MNLKNTLSLIGIFSLLIVVGGIISVFDSNKISILNNETATKAISDIVDASTLDPSKIDMVASTNFSSDDTLTLSVESETVTETTNSAITVSNNSELASNKQIASSNSDVYTGKLTGYGANCPGCSGNVACRTREGSKFNLYNDGIYYTDYAYGAVRILAADTSAFPCGTIVLVDNGIIEPFYGVVLDTGSSMRNAWKNGVVWMDLAFLSESSDGLYNATSSNTTFSVQRWGW